MTTADKIRALAKAGCNEAEIAFALKVQAEYIRDILDARAADRRRRRRDRKRGGDLFNAWLRTP